MNYVMWPAVWAAVVTGAVCVVLPALVKRFSEDPGEKLGRWLRRRSPAIAGGLFLAYVVWQLIRHRS